MAVIDDTEKADKMVVTPQMVAILIDVLEESGCLGPGGDGHLTAYTAYEALYQALNMDRVLDPTTRRSDEAALRYLQYHP